LKGGARDAPIEVEENSAASADNFLTFENAGLLLSQD
jgi:hypothetical protein